jgi:hypothetical protein
MFIVPIQNTPSERVTKLLLLRLKTKVNETNTIISDGQEFRVIATKSHRGTGFDGLAVAPIVNGQPDYKSIAVIAAGTDPGSTAEIYKSETTFSYYSVI